MRIDAQAVLITLKRVLLLPKSIIGALRAAYRAPGTTNVCLLEIFVSQGSARATSTINELSQCTRNITMQSTQMVYPHHWGTRIYL